MWVPDTAHEALRDLVRARLAAKRDRLRVRHRLGKRFSCARGAERLRAPRLGRVSTWVWVKQQRFEQPAQEATLLDYLHGVEHAAERSIDVAVQSMPAMQQAVIAGLQCLREVAKVSAVTLVSELG